MSTDALELIRSWPVANAAAGTVNAMGHEQVSGDADRPFALASVTKLLTAMAVLVAAEEGTVDLDEPLDRPAGATARDLLGHASGLAPDRDEALAPPRRRRIYSNRGYELLAARVEAKSGIPFATYLDEAVCQPLGMVATKLDGSPASGAVSSVRDLLRFCAALRRPRLVSAESLRAMTSIYLPDLDGVLPGYGAQRPNPWGLGPEIRGTKSPHWTGSGNSPRTFGHFGQAGTMCWVDPDADVALVALADRDFGDWAVAAWPALSDAVLKPA